MNSNPATERGLLARHPRQIAHMWSRIFRGRFGLVFGAGISKNLNLPNWKELIKRIARDPGVRGQTILNDQNDKQASSISQTLFQHFAARMLQVNGAMSPGAIRRAWLDVIRKQLYKKATKPISRYYDKHPYMSRYIALIKRIPMTITYNFDDFLEQFLVEEASRNASAGVQGKPYEVLWRPDVHPRRAQGVIHHPNGFLPVNDAEPSSDGLVFCENEFANQLMESISGRYASLLQYFSRHTCLLIGLSLEDSTLKYLLRQSAHLNPGYFHYLVEYEDPKKPTPKDIQDAVFEANFQVHNLITLFLTGDEIAALGALLSMDSETLYGRAREAGNTNLNYYYYVTGVPCAGKSSSITCLRNFTTYDEWLDARLPEMSQWPQPLKKQKIRHIDEWVGRQFAQKNQILARSKDEQIGMHVLDRCMLDPMSFKIEADRSERARSMLDSVCGGKRTECIQDGMVVLLVGDPDTMEERCCAAGKNFTSTQLDNMQGILKKAYKGKCLVTIDTRRKPQHEVIRDIVRLMFVGTYKPLDIKGRLENIEKGRFPW
ncbi:MAG: SIR2 family protein [Planctomycetota bacterium]